MNKVKFLFSAVLVIALLLIAACGAEETAEVQGLELQGVGLNKLVIDHRNGEITITGDPELDTIKVEPVVKTKGVSIDHLQLKLEAEGDTAYLDARFKGQFLATGSGSVDLEIKVPAQLALEIKEHRDGNIDISHLSSTVLIENTNGNIRVSNVESTVNIANRDGNIAIQEIGSHLAFGSGILHLLQAGWLPSSCINQLPAAKGWM